MLDIGYVFLVIIIALVLVAGVLLFIAWLGWDVEDYDDDY